jgi:hypothetical protein
MKTTDCELRENVLTWSKEQVLAAVLLERENNNEKREQRGALPPGAPQPGRA